MKSVVIGYWASTELNFIREVERLCIEKKLNFFMHKLSHHQSWFSGRRSIFINLAHLIPIFLRIMVNGFRGNVCAFGTNVCRGLFPLSFLFRKILFVYNELPETNSRRLLFYYDRFIFRHSKHIYVSTDERADYVEKLFDLNARPGVLENISVLKTSADQISERPYAIVFTGTIYSKRFFVDDLKKFEDIVSVVGDQIHLYGKITGSVSDKFNSLVDYKGQLSHESIIEELRNYRYGLLSYYTGEPNYDLCAPLKLYEYIAAGCRVISVNRNRGLIGIAGRYPALIIFMEDIRANIKYDKLDFYRQRESFLADAEMTNFEFAKLLVS